MRRKGEKHNRKGRFCSSMPTESCMWRAQSYLYPEHIQKIQCSNAEESMVSRFMTNEDLLEHSISIFDAIVATPRTPRCSGTSAWRSTSIRDRGAPRYVRTWFRSNAYLCDSRRHYLISIYTRRPSLNSHENRIQHRASIP